MAEKTPARQDVDDLDYCIRRVLQSGYMVDACNADDETTNRFGTPTPVRESIRQRPLSPPKLTPMVDRHAHVGFDFGAYREHVAGNASPPPSRPPPPSYPYTPYAPVGYPYPMQQRLPKLPQFSGEGKKEDVDFNVWKYEVNCLLKGGMYSDHLILESIRSSLKGKARSVLLYVGEYATVFDIMREMDAIYGSAASSEKLKEQFYSACQAEGESIVDYAQRLEQLLCNSRIDLDRDARDEMLRNKLWSGLRDQDLKNVSRYKFEAERDYTRFRRELRQIESDMKSGKVEVSSLKKEFDPFKKVGTDKGKKETEKVRQYTVHEESKISKQLEELTELVKSLNTRVADVEKGLQEMKNKGSGGWNRNRAFRAFKPNSQEVDSNQAQQTASQCSQSPTSPLNSQAPPSKAQ